MSSNTITGLYDIRVFLLLLLLVIFSFFKTGFLCVDQALNWPTLNSRSLPASASQMLVLKATTTRLWFIVFNLIKLRQKKDSLFHILS